MVQRLGIDALDELGELQRLLRRHRVPVHHVQRISGLPHVQTGKRAPRSANRIKIAAGEAFQDRLFLERGHNHLAGLLQGVRRRIGERETAEGKRHADPNLVAAHLDQFERAAAQVAHDPVRPVYARDHPERGESRLALAGKDFDGGAADLLRLTDEGGTVLCLTHSGGRDNAHVADLQHVA